MRFSFAFFFFLSNVSICWAQELSLEKTPTAAEIYSAIDESMKQYERFSFRVSFLESRIMPEFPKPPEPKSVMGNGDWSIFNDGTRWKCIEKTFDMKQTKAGITKKDVVRRAGYDGRDYWHDKDGVIYIGEKDFADSRLAPREVFWHLAGNRSWLQPILTKYAAKVTSTKVDDRPCWRIAAEVRDRRFEVVVSPTQSWLPLSTTIERDGKLYARETLSELKSTADGVWYPTLIEFTSPGAMFGASKSRMQVNEFSTAKAGFQDSDFEIEIPLNRGVFDYGKGFFWHNGPWWPDLAEFLQTEVGFPRKNPGCFSALRTTTKHPEANGKDAPPIKVRKWMNVEGDIEKPTAWSDRPDGITTILFFFHGLAMDPTSRKIHGLKELKRHYPNAPVQLIGIAASDAEEEEVRRTIETLDIDFPVAIDAPTDVAIVDCYGQSHQAFGVLRGVVLIDPEQKVRFVATDPSNPAVAVTELTNLCRFGTANPKQPVKPLPDYRTTLKESGQIRQRWLQLVKDAPADGSISGKILFIRGAATDRFEANPAGEPVGTIADLKLLPRMQVGAYNTPMAYETFADHSRTKEMQTDFTGEFEFTGLTKGRYELTISPPFGLAKITREFTVPAGDSKVDVGEIRLQQFAEITGVVVNEDDQPVHNAKIVAVARHFDPENLKRETNANLPSPQTTNEEGKFHFKDLHVGAYSFVVSADGYPETRQKPLAAGSKDAKLQLKK